MFPQNGEGEELPSNISRSTTTVLEKIKDTSADFVMQINMKMNIKINMNINIALKYIPDKV